MILILGLIMFVIIAIVDKKVVALGITIATGFLVVLMGLSVELSHIFAVVAVAVAVVVGTRTGIGNRHVGLHANIEEMGEGESVA